MKPTEIPSAVKTQKLATRKPRTPLESWQMLAEESAAKNAREKAHQADAEALISTIRLTTIAADINVGLGNTLYIRGKGEGLSWDKGVPLHCIGDSMWTWASTAVKDKAVFKLLLNDVVWAQGENLTVEAGKDLQVTPRF